MSNHQHAKNGEIQKVVVACSDVYKDQKEQRNMADEADVIDGRLPAREIDGEAKYRNRNQRPQSRRVGEHGANEESWRVQRLADPVYAGQRKTEEIFEESSPRHHTDSPDEDRDDNDVSGRK